MKPEVWRASVGVTLDYIAARLGVESTAWRTIELWFARGQEPPLWAIVAIEKISGGSVTAADWLDPMAAEHKFLTNKVGEGSVPFPLGTITSPASHLARDVRAWIGRLCVDLDVSPSELLREVSLPRAEIAYILRHAGDGAGIHSPTVLALEKMASVAHRGPAQTAVRGAGMRA